MTDEQIKKFLKGSEYLRETRPPKFNWWTFATSVLAVLTLATLISTGVAA